jgi:hypothetical protein
MAGCQTPTEVMLEVSTNAQCGDLRGTLITVGRLDEIETRPASAKTERCATTTGRIGSLAILPRNGDKDEFAIRVITGFYKTPEQCIKDGYVGGCIVARRVLSFVPNEMLTLPVAMESNCIDVPCGVTQTCRDGRCVSARLPDPQNCTDPAGCDGANGGSASGGSSSDTGGSAAGATDGGAPSTGGTQEDAGAGGVVGGNQGLGGAPDGGVAGAIATTAGTTGSGGSAGGSTGGVSGGGSTSSGGSGATCHAIAPKDCNGTCTSLDSDGNNCGACGVVCADLHGTASCNLGSCSSACAPGWDDCVGNYSCETQIAGSDVNHCGACGTPCNPAHAVPACSSGACQIASCHYGYANCDASQSTGCETQLMDVGNALGGFWSLDESSGSLAKDGSSNPHNGTLINMFAEAWISGPLGGALQFDGVNDYVVIGNSGARVKTLSIWMRNDFVPRPVTDTGERAPTANGSPHHDWASGGNAYADDGANASATFLVLGSASHDWSTFDFNIPAGATILGIEAKMETKVSSLSLGNYSLSLSWDGGSNFTSTKTIPSGLLGKSEQVYTLGGPADTWGHTWSASEVNNGLRVRADFSAIGIGTVYVDYITVKVTYRPYHGQKVLGFDGAAQIELVGDVLRATNFPGTTNYYVDGVSGTTVTSGWHHVVITNASGVDATSLEFGRLGGDYFVGALDEIRAYDRVLTGSEITFLSGRAGCP